MIYETSTAQDSLQVHLGGAVRFNYLYSSWDEQLRAQGGNIAYDVVRLNVIAAYKNVLLDAEYRLYASSFGGGFLKHAWMGYQFREGEQIQVGLASIPFALQPYTGNNWFFNIGYYVGLEDNYDMGIRYLRRKKNWDYDIAFFKNPETLDIGGGTELSHSRYGYDIVGRNKKINQLNGNLVYKTLGTVKQRIGISAQYGGLYNLDTKQVGNHYAGALAYEADYRSWNLKASFIHAVHNPINAAGESNQIVEMAAYGAAYEVATDFNLYTIGVAKNIDVNWRLFKQFAVYNDFGYMQKQLKSFENSYMNVTGLRTTIGPITTYIDYATGYNHSWFGGNFVDDFSRGNPDAKRHSRFNINLGYYF
ncbi:hypothetical protein M8998_02770 [Sphingobacterium sp. lm-10]|uniref:hypothetical protein n=1 Tax=Sphingobacterium sp. lm-10 TaxID=2944904 RepID=UPI002021AC33|nr:hypothetical protein [Sphingobacterium sp. lm-10]MCL7986858.1 hypothetical protein [Sphingobacterium sp. lm-10]